MAEKTLITERTLIIGAHFDDIAWTMAGLAALLAKNGQVDEAILTDSDGQGIAETRLAEEKIAMQILGISKLYNIGMEERFKDGELNNKLFEPMMAAVIKIINQAANEGFPYTRIISFGDDGYTGHIDHKAVASVALQAFENSPTVRELWQVGMSPQEKTKWEADYQPTGGYFVPIPSIDIEKYKPINIEQTFDLKKKAISAHQSQLKNGGKMHLLRIGELPKVEFYNQIKKQ